MASKKVATNDNRFAAKSDKVLALEAREIMEAYAVKANELRARGLIASFGVSNGADGKPCALVNFEVIKRIQLPSLEEVTDAVVES